MCSAGERNINDTLQQPIGAQGEIGLGVNVRSRMCVRKNVNATCLQTAHWKQEMAPQAKRLKFRHGQKLPLSKCTTRESRHSFEPSHRLQNNPRDSMLSKRDGWEKGVDIFVGKKMTRQGIHESTGLEKKRWPCRRARQSWSVTRAEDEFDIERNQV